MLTTMDSTASPVETVPADRAQQPANPTEPPVKSANPEAGLAEKAAIFANGSAQGASAVALRRLSNRRNGIMSPGADLVEAFNLFDPMRPLGPEDLDAYYVARPYAPLEPLKTYLRVNRQPGKVLFSGHRGSGKSTELRRLAKDLENEFFVVQATARTLDIADLKFMDIILACAMAIFRAAAERDLSIPADLWDEVFTWLTQEITRDTTVTVPASGSIGEKMKALLTSIEGKYGKEAVTRLAMRERLSPRLSELIERVNAVCQEIEALTGCPLLLIFEDIDKTNLVSAKELFFGYATTLNALNCRIIYTFPISLCYSVEFPDGVRNFSANFLLPNLNPYKRDGSPNSEGRDALKEVVLRRASPDIFDEEALEAIIALSGGLLRDLVRLVRDAILIALTNGKPVTASDMVQQVAAEMGNTYRRQLLPEHYVALRKARNDKEIVADTTVQELLGNLSLLEYRNGNAWCDVHPIVWQLLG